MMLTNPTFSEDQPRKLCERHEWKIWRDDWLIEYVVACRICGIAAHSPNSELEAMQLAGYSALRERREEQREKQSP